MSETIETNTPTDLASLCTAFRELRHNVNNSLGVMMAMSELAQMNPKNTEKMINIVLDRGPKIVTMLQEFGGHLEKVGQLQDGKQD